MRFPGNTLHLSKQVFFCLECNCEMQSKPFTSKIFSLDSGGLPQLVVPAKPWIKGSMQRSAKQHVAAQHQANEDVETSVITHPTPPQTDKTRTKRTVGFQPVLVGQDMNITRYDCIGGKNAKFQVTLIG